MANEQTAGTLTTETAAPVSDATLATAAPAATTTAQPEGQTQNAEVKAEVKGPEGETPEAKAEREAQEAADKAKADATKPPEKYDFKNPEGVELDPKAADTLKGLEAFAKKKGLSQDEAQELYELGIKASQGTNASIQERVASTQASWLEASIADKEFGGDKLNENMAIAQKAVDLNPEIKTLLNESKLGNHPEMIRWMYRVGKKLSEDSFIPGTRAPKDASEAAKSLYPNQN